MSGRSKGTGGAEGLTRRQMLTRAGAGTALAALAGGGMLTFLPGGVAAHTRGVIARVYGPAIAAMPATATFCDAYDAFVRRRGYEGLAFNAVSRLGLETMPPLERRVAQIERTIVQKFGMSTNVVHFAETGGELIFVGLQHPYENTCINQVSALAV